MKRIALLALATAVLGVGVPGPARADFHQLCATDTKPAATVNLAPPVARSGLLMFSGTVTCNGAAVEITSVIVTPLNGYAYPSGGTARCERCTAPISVTGTIPAGWWIYEVAMDFNVTPAGSPTVYGHRLGRYAATWAGRINPICPVAPLESCPA